MAVTFTPTVRHVYSIGDRKEAIIDLACSGTPTAGGDVLLASTLGFTQLDILDIGDVISNPGQTSALIISAVYGNSPYVSSVNLSFYSQVTAGATTALGAYTAALPASYSVRCRVIGKGSQVGVPS